MRLLPRWPPRDLCRFHRVTFKFSNRNIRPVDITAIITVYDKTDLLLPIHLFQGDQLIGLSDRRIGTVHRREVITVISRDIDMIAFNVQTLPDDTGNTETHCDAGSVTVSVRSAIAEDEFVAHLVSFPSMPISALCDLRGRFHNRWQWPCPLSYSFHLEAQQC